MLKKIWPSLIISLLALTTITACSNGHYAASHFNHQAMEQSAAESYAANHQSLLRSSDKQVVYFSYDNNQIAEAFRARLNKIAHTIKQTKAQIRLEGNTDERGSREYNVALGWRRAKAVEHVLQAAGIEPDQIEVISYGKEKPAQLGHNEQAWSKNRRVEMNISIH
jgi:peptidoglycan-associated lipoprotein